MAANIPPWLPWDLDERDIAIHEAAHIIAAYKYGFPLPSVVSIAPQFHYGGHVTLCWLGPSAFSKQTTADDLMSVYAIAVRFAAVILSGYIANFRLRRFSKGKSYFIVQAKTLPLSTPDVLCDGLDDLLQALHCLKDLAPHEDGRKSLMLAAWNSSWGYVGKWWPDIKHFAGDLLDRKSIGGDDLNTLVYGSFSPLTGGKDMRLFGRNTTKQEWIEGKQRGDGNNKGGKP